MIRSEASDLNFLLIDLDLSVDFDKSTNSLNLPKSNNVLQISVCFCKILFDFYCFAI